MFEPTQRNVDRGVEESMNLFERAKVGEVAPISARRPSHLLLVLDNSSQDPMSCALADYLRKRFDCRLTVIDARFEEQSNALAEHAAGELGGEAGEKRSGESFDQILAAAEQSGCDLILLPCPYGRDLGSVGPDSTGTVIDVLLARSRQPLLVVRQPREVDAESFERLRIVLLGENQAAPAAAAWAAGLVAPAGRLRLALILEEDFYQHVKGLLKVMDPNVDVTPEMLTNALAQQQVHLHRGLQKAAKEAGFEYEFHVLRESEPQAASLRDPAARMLLVVALDRSDLASQGHVQDRIRFSPHPVLVIPTP